MSSQNPEKDTNSYKSSLNGSTDKKTINESEKASAKWQDFSIASLNNVEYAVSCKD
jgi:hypothetical protein